MKFKKMIGVFPIGLLLRALVQHIPYGLFSKIYHFINQGSYQQFTNYFGYLNASYMVESFEHGLAFSMSSRPSVYSHSSERSLSPESSNKFLENTPYILLVEDNIVALKLLENLVKHENFRFRAVTNGESALEFAKKESFDLIISDIGLPGVSGIEFTHQFRKWEAMQHLKPIPIIGLTAHVRSEVSDEALQSGMNCIYTKPLLLKTLKAIILEFLYIDIRVC